METRLENAKEYYCAGDDYERGELLEEFIKKEYGCMDAFYEYVSREYASDISSYVTDRDTPLMVAYGLTQGVDC